MRGYVGYNKTIHESPLNNLSLQEEHLINLYTMDLSMSYIEKDIQTVEGYMKMRYDTKISIENTKPG